MKVIDPVSKNTIKELLMKDISEDKNFKKNFITNPTEALKNRYGDNIFELFDFIFDKEISGIIHVKIYDKHSSNENNIIHLIMLDSLS